MDDRSFQERTETSGPAERLRSSEPPHLPLDPRLVVVTESPVNAETPLVEHRGVLTEQPLFFRRNRFEEPHVSVRDWRLRVDGEVDRPLELRYEEILEMPARSFAVTLECAGNGRTAFSPPAEGEPWAHGAVSTAEWTGVPLSLVLERAGVLPAVREILAEGADAGDMPGHVNPSPFQRSLPLEKALHPDTMLAHTMNGHTLPRAHGYPLRLIVPGWYGIASVKWVHELTALTEPFTGFLQVERYVVPGPDGESMEPVSTIAVRSLITTPAEGQRLPAGRSRLTGLAWSGAAPVTLVEVSVDGGRTWLPASWTTEHEEYAWRGWEFECDLPPGEHELQSRATDAAGNTQPTRAPWNRLGYVNNSIQTVRVRCGPSQAGSPTH